MTRRHVPPILRQKMPWPKGRDPIGAEIPILIKEAEERIAAVAEYYGIDPDSPGWEEVVTKAEKRFEGVHLRGHPGQDADPGQAVRDFVLVYWVRKSLAGGGSVMDAVKQCALDWGVEPPTLRSRFYKLTRPRRRQRPTDKLTAEERAAQRMHEMAALFFSVIREHHQKN